MDFTPLCCIAEEDRWRKPELTTLYNLINAAWIRFCYRDRGKHGTWGYRPAPELVAPPAYHGSSSSIYYHQPTPQYTFPYRLAAYGGSGSAVSIHYHPLIVNGLTAIKSQVTVVEVPITTTRALMKSPEFLQNLVNQRTV
ncbi:hypothetical protein LguiB_014559 [Lonicera macranthoides]